MKNESPQQVVKRKWGEYKILHTGDKYCVKELSFEPDKAISYQRHFHRAEHWYVVEGVIVIELDHPNGDKEVRRCFEGDSFTIPSYTWHRATNVAPFISRVIETWTGDILSEDDIERREK